FDPAAPATWKLQAKLPKGSPERAELIKALGAPVVHPGETPLSESEAEALLDDPRAELVYGDRTISIVAPSMIQRQRKDHQDLLAIFLKPERVQAGAKFAREREPSLAKAEKAHGVDRHVVISILMWESRLGTITGDYVAFNAFTSQLYFIEEANTLALAQKAEKALVDEARQAERVRTIRDRARKNLLALVRQCKSRGIDPLAVKGSWAGALGFPQFMPFSLRWAEDGDGDGKIDLFTFDDSIASIANYLEQHGFAKSPEKAVWAYNHEDAYVKGVLAFAKSLGEELAKASPDAGSPLEAGEAPSRAPMALDAGAPVPDPAGAAK
ncbi:MAG: lytic murein transglycosylase, partial [Deltaproteobacteria bacterium]|nr:lytic murein transglycosylase [Deltaproteobacteria bacterium]